MGNCTYKQRTLMDSTVSKDWISFAAKKCGTYPVLVHSLLTRGIPAEKIEAVLTGDDIPVIRLNGSVEAARTIEKHLRGDGDIRIFADYDCDGITSGYVMYRGLCDAKRKIGSSAHIFVKFPQRAEGYGLSMETALQWAVQGASLVITVDNGITKKDEVAFLRANNIDVVVTDHHEPQKSLLPAQCPIVNPCYSDRQYSGMAGVAVAWNVLVALHDELGIDAPDYGKYIPAVALGTISDVMPFTWYNAEYIKAGLAYINQRKTPKLFSLLKEEVGTLGVTASDLGFSLAPRINAASRIGSVSIAGLALCAEEDGTVEAASDAIKKLNEDRKVETKRAVGEIEKMEHPANARFAVFDGKDYPKGIHGILAGEVTKKFPDYPAYVYSVDENGMCHGSIRCANESLDTLSLLKSIPYVKECAGHENACVMSVEERDLQKVIESFSRLYDSMEIVQVTKMYDAKTSLAMLNENLLEKVNAIPYSPHDMPVFCVPGVLISEVTPSKSNPSNIKLKMSDNTAVKTVWAWGFAEKYRAMGEPRKATVICNICQDFMSKNRTKATLRIVDLLPEG